MMTDAEIEAFVRAFEGCTLPAGEWTHRAHLTVALWYLRRHARDEATNRIRAGILRYGQSRGSTAKYHETITLAWAAVVSRFLDGRDPSEAVSSLNGALMEECGRKDFLLQYYSEDVLMSDLARRTWVPPDLRPIEPRSRVAQFQSESTDGR
jgi:hypothetical protein